MQTEQVSTITHNHHSIEAADIQHYRKNKTHNSRPSLALTEDDSFHIRNTTDKHHQALLLLF